MTQEEKGKTYALHKASEKLYDYYGSAMLNVVQFDGYDIQRAYVDGYLQAEQNLKVKEVDLEKEIQQHVNDCLDIKFPITDIKMITKDVEYTARKFFELGLKAR